ncbi:clathrin light chain-domain-containing protein [Schizophyllum amplum]|uniref:Clathrin light chain n=1 Tax=Schizophyllum amplum TaxID=97359 RepID=A0A550CVY1_9AGAR|nr:clathrin light chain-domain-containing protein [Auriculariopsis ampla]
MDDDLLGGFSTSKSGGDDIDFDAAASQFPDISLDGEGDFPALPDIASPVAPVPAPSFSLDALDGPTPSREVKVTGDDEIEQFTSHFPDIEVPQASPPPLQQQPSLFGAGTPTIAPRPQASAFSSTPILNQGVPEEEPEVIKQWRERRAEEIRERDAASKAKRDEIKGRAEAAIDEFYGNYATQKERNIRENKDAEEEFVSSLTASLTAGTTWERICNIIELENSQSKTIARAGPGTTDLSRFKEVLLRLKREGDRAPGAAGY